jgi:hypothetical protein
MDNDDARKLSRLELKERPEAVKAWLDEQYPKIEKQAKAEHRAAPPDYFEKCRYRLCRHIAQSIPPRHRRRLLSEIVPR